MPPDPCLQHESRRRLTVARDGMEHAGGRADQRVKQTTSWSDLTGADVKCTKSNELAGVSGRLPILKKKTCGTVRILAKTSDAFVTCLFYSRR